MHSSSRSLAMIISVFLMVLNTSFLADPRMRDASMIRGQRVQPSSCLRSERENVFFFKYKGEVASTCVPRRSIVLSIDRGHVTVRLHFWFNSVFLLGWRCISPCPLFTSYPTMCYVERRIIESTTTYFRPSDATRYGRANALLRYVSVLHPNIMFSRAWLI
jgi:hypothetical protein